MTDRELRQLIVDELEFEPSVDASDIGVSVEHGVVTLTGHVGSYAEKLAVERAARKVKGVRAIAQNIEIRYPSDKKDADDEIAARALKIIAWDTTLPDDAVQIKVEEGWVTLTGKVAWQFQKAAAERAVRKLSGVVGVTNQIELKPATPLVQPEQVRRQIEQALRRSANVESKGIRIRVDNDKVVLDGQVGTWHERSAVGWAAWSVPGVQRVENHLSVGD
ncbi:MAG TPA: BON domain-containing protein [Hyphomicrobiales bacterium]|nr:BON domain-containing protein [Hyphomicrobiales bacterium]